MGHATAAAPSDEQALGQTQQHDVAGEVFEVLTYEFQGARAVPVDPGVDDGDLVLLPAGNAFGPSVGFGQVALRLRGVVAEHAGQGEGGVTQGEPVVGPDGHAQMASCSISLGDDGVDGFDIVFGGDWRGSA